MALKLGYEFRITRHEANRKMKAKLKIRIGTIAAVNNSHFTVQFKNFKESFRISEIEQHDMQIKVDGIWRKLKIKKAS